MKKPIITYRERYYATIDTLTGALVRLGLAKAKFKRALQRAIPKRVVLLLCIAISACTTKMTEKHCTITDVDPVKNSFFDSSLGDYIYTCTDSKENHFEFFSRDRFSPGTVLVLTPIVEKKTAANVRAECMPPQAFPFNERQMDSIMEKALVEE